MQRSVRLMQAPVEHGADCPPTLSGVTLIPEPYETMRRASGLTTASVIGGLAAIWLLPGLLAGGETYAFWLMADRDLPAWKAFATQVPAWLTFAALTPFVLRYDGVVSRSGWPRPVRWSLHAPLAMLACALYAAVATLSWKTFVGAAEPVERLVLKRFLGGLPVAAVSYLVILGGGRAVYWFWRHRESALLTARLETRLSEARLATLRAQLNPHFFFNCLNTVTVLVRDGETHRAVHMLELMAGVMRDALRNRSRQASTLAEELSFVRRYLQIERIRFADRLQVQTSVADDIGLATVPTFLLQPLVENALRHGISQRPEGGKLAIRAWKESDRLRLRIENDGPGPNAVTANEGTQLGLAATRERLALTFGEEASCDLRPGLAGGAVVDLCLPYVEASTQG